MASANSLADVIDVFGRPVICAERKKLSAMGRCQHAHIVSTIKRNVFSLRLKRSAILLKGKWFTSTGGSLDADRFAVQNISRDWRIASVEWSLY